MALALALQPAPVSARRTQTPAQLAQVLQSAIGRRAGSLTILRVDVEGQNVVIVLAVPAGWQDRLSADDLSRRFSQGFCMGDLGYFVGGQGIRIDTIEEGSPARTGPVILACPPDTPGGQHARGAPQ